MISGDWSSDVCSSDLLLALALTDIALNPGFAREYQRHLTESRPAARLDWHRLPALQDETSVRAALAPLEFRCWPLDDDSGLGDRRCDADISAFNGIPAMFASAYFRTGRLVRLAIAVPWWRHGSMHDTLTSDLGATQFAEWLPRHGTRLAGWALPDGSRLLVNRERHPNPLIWSQIFWERQGR